SSRRRHTRSYGDWSSDVCSSDLGWVYRARVCSGLVSAWLCLDARSRSGAHSPRRSLAIVHLHFHSANTQPVVDSFCSLVSLVDRSEERRVGKECRARWWEYCEVI